MLSPNTKLGPYEILAQIGAGGMGEVYKSRDTRLDRIVAVKILPAHMAERPEVRERFEREARTIAALNHPHICTLYDIGRQDGTDFLVMEYLEGETLAARLQKGPLPLEQVLQYAVEIADALDKAHRKGAIHRDIKPGNIMLTKSGTKLLDFGLAKLKRITGPATPESQLPTLAQNPTVEGTILGTLQYMSPEQLEGQVDAIDARSDIFSFGTVVYEMATGKKAFEGKSSASLIGAILKDTPPPVSSLAPMSPPALDRVVRTCLEKDPDERWQTASDLRRELKFIAESGPQSGVSSVALSATLSAATHAATAPVRKSRQGIAWASLAAAVVVATVIASAIYFRPAPVEAPAVHFSVDPPDKGTFSEFPWFLAVSPDGSKLAFAAADGTGKLQLWIRPLNSSTAQPLPGTDGGNFPFWSPDSRSLGFFADGKLKKVDVSGGPAQTLVENAGGGALGAWNGDGVVVFGRTGVDGASLFRVSAAGGTATPRIPLDTGRQEVSHAWPNFLPDGKHFLFLARSAKVENNAIFVGSLDSKERKLLLSADSKPVYVPPGYLLFNRQGTLMAQPFDAGRLELTGEAFPIAEGIQFSTTLSSSAFAASENGVLAYRSAAGESSRTLVWVSRNGAEQPVAAPAHDYQQPRLSPDGRRVVLEINEPQSKVWLYDLARDTLTRLTFQGDRNDLPIWTPDGKRATVRSTQDNPQGNIFWQMADGSGGRERLTTSPNQESPSSWSPDGRLLAFTDVDQGSTGRDIWVLSVADRKAQPFLRTPFVEGAPEFSPDGRWMAYVSNESGRFEIYVQAYPGPGGKWQISTDGGAEPVWNRNGRELFFRSGTKMMAVDISMQPAFSAGTPRMLFDKQYVSTPIPQTFRYFDVSPDGQRFLMVKQGERSATPISVVLNWPEDMRRRAPSGKQ